MDSFEANKIIGAVLGTIFVLFGGSLLAEGIFHSEAPEQPGYAIVAPDEPEAGAAGGGEAPAEEPIAVLLASADAEAGAGVFKRCASCHNGGKGEANKVGPVLWDVVNRPIASVPGFGYSAAMQAFSEGGAVAWDYEHLNGFLVNPKGHVPGTSMGFAGLKKPDERANLIAYLRSLSDSPAPLPEAPAAAPADAPAAPAEGAAAPEAAPAAGAEAPAEGAPAAAAPEVTEPSATTNAGNPAQQPQAPATTDVDTIMPPIGDPTTMVPSAGQPGTGAAPGGAGTNEPTANSSTAPAAQGTVQPGTQGVSATQQQQEQEQRLQQQQQPAAPAEAAPAQPAPVQPPPAAPAPTEAVPAPAAPVPVEAAPAPAAPAQPPSGTQQFTVPVQPAPTAPQPQ